MSFSRWQKLSERITAKAVLPDPGAAGPVDRRGWEDTVLPPGRSLREGIRRRGGGDIRMGLQQRGANTRGLPVAVVVGATSKWQADGRNTKLAHGRAVDDSHLPVGVRWGVGGAIAQKFAAEGFFTVLTTRAEANASVLAAAIRDQGGACMIVELDLVSQDSIAAAFRRVREEAGDPEVLVYNAGY